MKTKLFLIALLFVLFSSEMVIAHERTATAPLITFARETRHDHTDINGDVTNYRVFDINGYNLFTPGDVGKTRVRFMGPFPVGADLIGSQLSILSATRVYPNNRQNNTQQIIVALSLSVAPGTYTLRVMHRTGPNNAFEHDDIDVTIGAVGPVGPSNNRAIEVTGNYQMLDNDSGSHFFIKSPAAAPGSPTSYTINLPPTTNASHRINFKLVTENMVPSNVTWLIVSDQNNFKGFICHWDGCTRSMNSANTQRHNTIKIPPLTQEGQSITINGYKGSWYIDSGSSAGLIMFGPR